MERLEARSLFKEEVSVSEEVNVPEGGSGESIYAEESSEHTTGPLSFREKLLEESYNLRHPESEPSEKDLLLLKAGKGIQSSLVKYGQFDEQLFDNETLSDVKLRINGGEKCYHAHKVFLVMRSEYFKTLFTSSSDWEESASDYVDLTVETHLSDVFEEFLRFLYTGRVELHRGVIWSFYFLADQYIVKRLTQLLSDFVCKTLLHEKKEPNDETGKTKYEPLSNYSHHELINFVEYFETDDVSSSAGAMVLHELESIDKETFNKISKQAILRILKSKALYYPNYGCDVCNDTKQGKRNINEYTLFRSLIDWFNADGSRKESAEEVLSCIRYGRISFAKELREVSRNELVIGSPVLSRLVAVVTQEFYFALQLNSYVIYYTFHEYQKAFKGTEESRNLFKPRVIGEHIGCECRKGRSNTTRGYYY